MQVRRGSVCVEVEVWQSSSRLIYGCDNEDRVQPDHGSGFGMLDCWAALSKRLGYSSGGLDTDMLSRKFNFAELYRSETRDSSVDRYNGPEAVQSKGPSQ